MSSRIDPVRPGDAMDDSANELLSEAEEGWYGDAAFFGAMAHQPTLFKRTVELLRAFPQSDHLSPELLELVRLKIAETHQCAYCATVRTEAVREAVEPKEEAVFGTIDGDSLTRREELAVRFGEQLSSSPQRITDEDIGALRSVFDEEALVELLLFASLEIGLDRFCIALNLDTTERSRYPTGLEYPYETSDSAAERD